MYWGFYEKNNIMHIRISVTKVYKITIPLLYKLHKIFMRIW